MEGPFGLFLTEYKKVLDTGIGCESTDILPIVAGKYLIQAQARVEIETCIIDTSVELVLKNKSNVRVRCIQVLVYCPGHAHQPFIVLVEGIDICRVIQILLRPEGKGQKNQCR